MSPPRVAIVGGGLASLAAATVLADAACDVTILEARKKLGGRAASFRDPSSDELVDFCQHVGMGCCTYLLDFLKRHQLVDHFRRKKRLLFVGPSGEMCRFHSCNWLPAPLHLLPAFLRLKYFTAGERGRLARALTQLARVRGAAGHEIFSLWLSRHNQSANCVDWFWRVVLESALGESLDRVSTHAARQVFVAGFMANRRAYELLIPQVPLVKLFDQLAAARLEEAKVQIRRGTAVRKIATAETAFAVTTDGGTASFDRVIVAVPWRAVRGVLADELQSRLTWLPAVESLPASPITGIHLWFDRPITDEPHAVLVGRLSQWLFSRGVDAHVEIADANERLAHYYQVVISASRMLANQDRTRLVNQVVAELADIWPAARQAQLLRHRIVTEPHAVFARNAQTEAARPDAATIVPGLFVAGDWTNTGWPATMEGAVRSGYAAARALLISEKRLPPAWSQVADLPRGVLARWICGRDEST
jgi:squalene-associated FAD-dependent desaturase